MAAYESQCGLIRNSFEAGFTSIQTKKMSCSSFGSCFNSVKGGTNNKFTFCFLESTCCSSHGMILSSQHRGLQCLTHNVQDSLNTSLGIWCGSLQDRRSLKNCLPPSSCTVIPMSLTLIQYIHPQIVRQ